jgi:hypothetical protein
MMVQRGQPWDSMGELGTSKELAPFREESLENFPARQTLTRDHPSPSQGKSTSRKNSHYVPVNNLVKHSAARAFVLHPGASLVIRRRQRKRKGQTACKPGSVRLRRRDDHSSGTHLTMRLTRPTRAARQERLRNNHIVTLPPPLFGLAPGGVYHAAPVARDAVRSCRTVSPLPAGSICSRSSALRRRFTFCGTFPGVAPAGR